MAKGQNLAVMAAVAAIAFLWARDAEAANTESQNDGLIQEGEPEMPFEPDYYEPPPPLDFMDYWGPSMQKLSGSGLSFLKEREGFAAVKYPDHKGFSIGYGHLIRPGESFAEPMDIGTATQLLAQDVAWAEDAVRSNVKVALTQNQFDALVSFVYNVGAGAFKQSTLLRKLNALDATAPAEFARWVYASGAVNDGLVDRRELEAELFTA